MRSVLVDLDEEYQISIIEIDEHAYDFIIVNINHPNIGWGPWFFLYKIPDYIDKWNFVATSSVTKEWALKQLKNVETGTKVDEWVKEETNG